MTSGYYEVTPEYLEMDLEHYEVAPEYLGMIPGCYKVAPEYSGMVQESPKSNEMLQKGL